MKMRIQNVGKELEITEEGGEVVSSPLDDLCIDIWISVMIICLTTQITERRGTAMC